MGRGLGSNFQPLMAHDAHVGVERRGLSYCPPERNFEEIQLRHLLGFLLTLYHPEERVCVVIIRHDRTIQRFVKVRQIWESLLRYLRYENVRGGNIHITVNTLKPNAKSRKEDGFVRVVKKLWFDIDSKNGISGDEKLQRLRELLGEETLLVETSPGNYQVYYLLSQPVPYEQAKGIMQVVEKILNLDPVHDITRLMRLPGFANYKPGKNNYVSVVRKSSRILEVESLESLNIETQIQSEVKTTKHENRPETKSKFVPHSVRNFWTISAVTFAKLQALYEECLKVPKPSRSEVDAYFAVKALRAGFDPEDVKKFLRVARRDKRKPEYYAELTVNKALRFLDSNP